MNAKLRLSDIADLRAYERERPEFLKSVIALKALRRVALGPYITVVFENRTTVRFQIQEMARAERMVTDEQIQTELDIYNPLIGSDGELSMTLFIELRSEDELRTWLPRLVGIESSIAVVIGEGKGATIVRAVLDADHARQLTRDEITASVHYLRIDLGPELVSRFANERVFLAAQHPAYLYETELSDATKTSLRADWHAS